VKRGAEVDDSGIALSWLLLRLAGLTWYIAGGWGEGRKEGWSWEVKRGAEVDNGGIASICGSALNYRVESRNRFDYWKYIHVQRLAQ
jgi:hypothetical protein